MKYQVGRNRQDIGILWKVAIVFEVGGTIYVVAGKKNPKLIVNDNEFEMNLKTGNQTIWRCRMYYQTKCKARLWTFGNKLTKRNVHNHSPMKPFYHNQTPLNVNIVG
ncbi:hypothetical protein HHI36_012684 [Cryptolaemus montrouzieri]|uniref:FLYWCH-type domain-containing protein n=1 Tax=Cryptolaemus montrouzieri TaxID=559131 RepID=A0ABD2NEZ1_9CUCU